MRAIYSSMLILTLFLTGVAHAAEGQAVPPVKPVQKVNPVPVPQPPKKAPPLDVYQAPHDNAAVIATLKPGTVIMPIFQKAGWVKIGNPANGDTGWVKKEALQKGFFPHIYIRTYYQKPGPGGRSALFESTVSGTIDPKKVDKMMQNLNQQSQAIQKNIEQFMQQGMENLQRFNKKMQAFVQKNSKEKKGTIDSAPAEPQDVPPKPKSDTPDVQEKLQGWYEKLKAAWQACLKWFEEKQTTP